MSALDKIAQKKLEKIADTHLLRSLRHTERQAGVHVMQGGRQLVSFSCNDYLGLSHHPQVIAAGIAALSQYGAGAGASRLVTGNHSLYEVLEKKLADYKNTQVARVFGSGYLANIGTIPALAEKGDLIVADKLMHACLIDGAVLSGARLLRFAHNDLEHCETLLHQHRANYRHCLIVTETVFSMDGDIAPVTELAALAKRQNAWLMTDDAHGLGVVSEAEKTGADIRMGTLSKTLGVYGGYVCASSSVIDLLTNNSRSLIYSTALPPAVIASAIAALDIVNSDAELIKKPLANAQLFTSLLGLPIAQSPLVPVILKDAQKALKASSLLEEKGFLVAAIRPPTVPAGTARLRFAFSALHTRQQIENVADVIAAQGWM